MTNENKKKLVELLAKNDVPLIEDDIYGRCILVKQGPNL